MSLPNAYAPITSAAFYPDLATINFQYNIRFSYVELIKGLRSNGFTSRGSFFTHRINLDGPQGYRRAGFPLRITRPRFAAPLNCFLDFNPLRVLHAQRSDYAGEMSAVLEGPRASGTNWMHADLVEPNCRPVWALCQWYIEIAQTKISEIIEDIQRQSGGAHIPSPVCTHVSVHTVECAIDFGTNNPRQLVVDFLPAFAALLRDNQHREYSAGRVIGLEANLMVHGFVNTATRVKMYCRTNRRARFETLFRPDTFDRFRISRTLTTEHRNFDTLFEQCAEKAHELFLALRARTARSLNLNSTHTPLDLVVCLISSTRRQDIVREVLDCLLRTGKVQNSLYDRHLVDRLKKIGLLEPSLAHGFSCIASHYGHAAALLSNSQEDYFTHRLRRPVDNLLVAKKQLRVSAHRSGLLRR